MRFLMEVEQVASRRIIAGRTNQTNGDDKRRKIRGTKTRTRAWRCVWWWMGAILGEM